MLSRDRKLPPSTSLASISGDEIVACRSRSSTSPARISDCGELRPVDQHDVRPGRRGSARREFLARAPGRHRASRRSCARESARSRRAWCRRRRRSSPWTGRIQASWKASEIVAGDARDRRRIAGAGERHAIGMRLAVEQRRQGPQRDALRLRHLLRDPGELLAAQPLDLGRREGGMADDVGEQVERGGEVGRQRGQADVGPVHAGAGADRRAEPFLLLGDLDAAVAVACLRRAGRASAIGCRACPSDRRHCRRRS